MALDATLILLMDLISIIASLMVLEGAIRWINVSSHAESVTAIKGIYIY